VMGAVSVPYALQTLTQRGCHVILCDGGGQQRHKSTLSTQVAGKASARQRTVRGCQDLRDFMLLCMRRTREP